MAKQIINGLIPGIKSSKKESTEEYENGVVEPLLSRFHPPSPSTIIDGRNTKPLRKYPSRFGDDTDVNERVSPQTTLGNYTAKNDRFQSSWLKGKNHFSRWPDEYQDDPSKQPEQVPNIKEQHLRKDKNVDLLAPARPQSPAESEMSQAFVQEFYPTFACDPVFAILRELFIFSFDDYYKQIETQLNLKGDKSLIQWLDAAFNDEQQAILERKYRCFILYANIGQSLKENIIGFLTLQEEESGSIYIAQVAISRKYKRRGYGEQLLQHLRRLYPPNTSYWGLCRRANKPAVNFYLQLGAVFMDTDDDAKKYGYDPQLYAGFKFIDVPSIVASPGPVLGRSKNNANNIVQQSITSTNAAQSGPSLRKRNGTRHRTKPAKKKVVGCCTVS